MTGTAEPEAQADLTPADAPQAGVSRLGWALIGGSTACLLGAGLLLWSRHGAAVFGDVVLAAIAWCF